MANTLSVAPLAESDLKEAFNWYEARSHGLGHEFFRCVEARLNLIARAPQVFRQRGPWTFASHGENRPLPLRHLFHLGRSGIACHGPPRAAFLAESTILGLTPCVRIDKDPLSHSP
jgi:hypothetical protein